MLSLVVIAAFVGFVKAVLMFLFILTALLLITIVLLQEGKGGGLAGAFGGAGAETFGVQTGGVNKFTAWVAATFMVLAVAYATIKPDEEATAPSAGVGTIDDGGAGGAGAGNADDGSEDADSESGDAGGGSDKTGSGSGGADDE